ncbi:MAG: NYN domain-containing protein, partial [Bacteroidia bacterium]
ERWKNVLLENAITPIQQYGYTTGKNSTDSAMIIDAMDILYSERVNGFCIVSSDSDFTRLATRLREAGMKVFGIGEKKTPNPFIVACDKFIYIEILKKRSRSFIAPTKEVKSKHPAAEKPITKDLNPATIASRASIEEEKDEVEKITPEVIKLIAATVSDAAEEDGWAFLGDVGSLLVKKQPNFDSRNYGFEKLTPLIHSTGKFDIEQRSNPNPKSRIKLIYVKNKE